ncbi:helix-turn-helix domain-containing protein [Flavobacterium sp. M31R6]|uniref:helix-turn-helix domain-containing protein n=1 Tax=Flavobacterium sp. M31R6 TaxID=2739062 RepID=UPI0020C57204|nr:helix-turn-helix domain-containing protein [Flavobacterium sp. M31R6]
MKKRIDKGREVVNLVKNNKPYSCRICVLVAVAFLRNHKNYTRVRNINGVKSENQSTNLEWNDFEGVFYDGKNGGSIGSKNGRAKITEAQVLDIRSSDLKQREISEKYGISQSAVSSIKNFQLWTHL